jgi:hypothetical protein
VEKTNQAKEKQGRKRKREPVTGQIANAGGIREALESWKPGQRRPRQTGHSGHSEAVVLSPDCKREVARSKPTIIAHAIIIAMTRPLKKKNWPNSMPRRAVLCHAMRRSCAVILRVHSMA